MTHGIPLSVFWLGTVLGSISASCSAIHGKTMLLAFTLGTLYGP
jgi:hypothetical protein